MIIQPFTTANDACLQSSRKVVNALKQNKKHCNYVLTVNMVKTLACIKLEYQKLLWPRIIKSVELKLP